MYGKRKFTCIAAESESLLVARVAHAFNIMYPILYELVYLNGMIIMHSKNTRIINLGRLLVFTLFSHVSL